MSDQHYHGMCIMLGSLRVKHGIGIGSYTDLIPMIDLISKLNGNILQLLPLNDSGEITSPYSALSAFALHPIYISFDAYPFLVDKQEFRELKILNDQPWIPYKKILHLKEALTAYLLEKEKESIQSSKEYQTFIAKNQWLLPYAVFKQCSIIEKTSRFPNWTQFTDSAEETIKRIQSTFPSEVENHKMIQFLCYKQLKQVYIHASKKRVHLKGDIPILVSPNSCDVWLHKNLFSRDISVGAPPDEFNPKGQDWGFPMYVWDEHINTHFAWWKSRIAYASNFFHFYRLDHVVGFFRLWGQDVKDQTTHFIPAEKENVKNQGRMILRELLSCSPMQPIAEDLGLIPYYVTEVLRELNIATTSIMRWQKMSYTTQRFKKTHEYPKQSLTSVSTHDTSTLQEWWYTDEGKTFAQTFKLPYHKEYDTVTHFSLLKIAHATSSRFHINLLQEYLALQPSFVDRDPQKNRINIPGTINEKNWTYRMKPSIEEVMNDQVLCEKIKACFLEKQGRAR